MDFILPAVLFAAGLVIIIKGGDLFVDASVLFAEATGIPKFVIGATIVSLATTLPELLVSSFAVAGGSNGIAIGNAVGSVTANIGLIMGISACALPTVIDKKDFGFKGFLMILSGVLIFVFSLDGGIVLWEAFIIIAVLAVFIGSVFVNHKKDKDGYQKVKVIMEKRDIALNTAKFIGGAAMIVLGANLLVENGKELASLAGIPDAVIGLTIVAIGTSLPELVTTLTAIAKKETSMGVGNILGANIIDMTLILPICSFISGGTLTIEQSTLWIDIPVCVGLMAITVIPTVIQGKFRRYQGILMLLVYIAYLAAVVTLK